jgi:nicotinate-nucleotide--dimethylbenzimidazole phosphoribosyltransferase
VTGVPAPGAHGGDGRAVAAALGLDPESVLDLSQSLNPVAPDAAAVVGRHLHAVRAYPDPRAATAALAAAMGVDAQRLVLTNGGSEAIALVSAELGGRVDEPEFALHPRGAGPRWRSNPHNPTGVLAPPGERAGVWDEAFYPLATGRWTRGDADAVVVGSLTKLLACPGLRVGYVLAAPGLAARVRERQPQWAVNGLVAASLPELLDTVDLPAWSARVGVLRAALADVLAGHGLVAKRSDANWVLVDAPGLRDRLAPAGVIVRDCTGFGLPGTVRIAVPSERGLERLDAALAATGPAPSPPTSSPFSVPPHTGTRRAPPRKDHVMPPTTFTAAAAAVHPTDAAAAAEAGEHHDRLTKPRGALGRLEDVGIQLAAVTGECPPPVPEPVTVAVFAGDHGVVAQGVTPWPQEVTAQMVANFCGGGAAVNVLARHVGAKVVVVDVGVATPIPADAPDLLRRNVRAGTRDLAEESAMDGAEVAAALDAGAEVAALAVGDGARLLVTGDMGIGNTTPSAALIAALTGRDPAEVTGRGTGVDDATLGRKVAVVERAMRRLPAGAGPLDVLAEVGGLEIAALAGFVVGAAAHRVPVVVDGVIAAAATLVAVAAVPDALGYVIAGHRSSEPGSAVALEFLGLDPVLDLDLRLGEGSGALLAVPAVQASAKILREMATFDAAGVTDKGDPRD